MPNEYKNYNEYNKLEDYEENLESKNDEDSRDDYVSSSERHSATNNNLSRSQKVGVVSLAFFALFVVILWSIQFKSSINKPFNRNSQELTEDQTGTCSDGSCQSEDSEASLKAKDTDKDGLSDWDELNIYNTSPYLEDSDSDGFLDKAEIDSNNDPNCPTGRDCYNSADAQIDADNSLENSEAFDIFSQIQGEATGISETDYSDYSETNEGIQNLLEGQADASTIRQLLISAGVDESLISNISDEEIMEIYLESLNQ